MAWSNEKLGQFTGTCETPVDRSEPPQSVTLLRLQGSTSVTSCDLFDPQTGLCNAFAACRWIDSPPQEQAPKERTLYTKKGRFVVNFDRGEIEEAPYLLESQVPIDLTASQLTIIDVLTVRPGRAVTPFMIGEALDPTYNDRPSMDVIRAMGVHISRIRHRIGEDKTTEYPTIRKLRNGFAGGAYYFAGRAEPYQIG